MQTKRESSIFSPAQVHPNLSAVGTMHTCGPEEELLKEGKKR